ncbi:MAG: TonB-dependent receptor domain-containing protein [Blastocatellia bacterium]
MKSITSAWLMAFTFVLVMTVMLCASTALRAQEARGSISGKVRDAGQAIVPGASVKITNSAMGTTVSVTTNDAGFFQVPLLLPGVYQVTVESKGFKKYVRDGIQVRVNDSLELDLTLEVGDVGETVTVTGDAPPLETTTASMGQVIDQRRIAELPIAHGDPFKLIGLSTGVSFTGSLRLDRPFEPTHIVGYSMDGTRGNRSDITIDGVASTATANANEVISSYVPPQDLVQEFKVQTATFDASSGNTEGGVTNLSIKAGTNNFHGTAYWTKMAPRLFANDFFANANNIARPNFDYNRWGGTVGGPVRIPKVYNGQNKTFFMYGIEGIPEARPRNNGTPTVPTDKMKQGDFSDLLKLGAQYQIYNPFTRRSVAGGRFQQDPFPGNIIPANLINPIARKVVDSYFPAPLTAGNADGTNNFQNPSLTEEIKYLTNTIRIDHVVSERQRIFGRLSWYNRDSNYNNYFGNIATGEAFLFKSRQATFDDVFTVSPTMVLNFRYGYNRFIRGTNSNPGNRGFDLTSLGFPSSYAALIPEDIRRFPRFDITGYQGTGVGGELRPNDTHSLVAVMNKSLRTHALKAGVEFRSYRETSKFFANNQTGQFNFDATWTRGPLDNAPTAPGSLGQSFAAFLLGVPSSGGITRAADYAEQSTTTGIFLHDDWRFNSRLTLNLGLRWEIEGALTERYNRSVSGFDYGFVHSFEAAARTAYARNPTQEVPVDQFNIRGGLLFAGINGQSRGLYETPKKNFMPRLGFAYKLTDKTVVRGGYGIFFGFLGQRRGDVIQSGFSLTTPFIPSLNNGLSFVGTLSNPFPNGIQEPVGASQGPSTFLGQSVTFFNPRPLSPYMQRWQVGMQRELIGGLVGEISYVGNRGTHIEVGRNLNALSNKYLSTSTSRDQARIDYLSQNVPNPLAGLMPAAAGAVFRAANIARSRLLVPFPQFDAVNTTTNEGYSWYHSLQMDLEKRFSRGYTIGASYTFSKFMEATELLNAGDPRPTEVISSVDRPHRFTVNGIYEIPLGKGRAYLAKTNAVVSRLISGWQVSGIYAYQSGSPVGFGNVIFTGDVANLALPGNQQTVARWFNTDAGFNKVAAQQLGSNVRTFPLRFGSVRANPINNYDLSVIKNTEVWESKSLQFRAEFLNAFNHPFFPAPNTNPTVVQFGTVQASTQDNYPRRIQLTVKFLF